MTGYPLLYLTVHSIRNRARVRLRRLREPRYLIGAVLGGAYFAFFILGQSARGRSPSMMRVFGREQDTVELGLTVLLFAIAALAWIWPGTRRPALAFSRAEVQHLFTAPITRRHLVRYRMLRSQLGALFGSAIVTLLLRPAGVGHAVSVFVGLTLFMAIANLHLTGVSLSRASRGARRSVPRRIAAAAVIVVGATLAMNWSELTAIAAAGGSVAAELARLSTTGAAGMVLWPFRAVARLPLAPSPEALLAALPWALPLLAFNYVWVLRTDVPFEEASAELSEKLDELRRRGPSALNPPRASPRTPFKLALHGRPEMAIAWKNLISMGRVLSWTALVRVAPLLVLLALALSRGRADTASVLTFASLFVAGAALMMGPQLTRSDLRQDLTALGVLKTWPVRGAALLRGEMLAPAIVLTVIVWLALIAAAVVSVGAPFAAAIAHRWMWLGAALLVSPGIVLVQLLAQNAMAVTFPSWVDVGVRQAGVDVMGQRLLAMFAVMLGLVVALLPAAIAAVVIAAILYALTGTIWPILPAAAAAIVLMVEVYAGTEIVGAILERTDLSAVDATES